jgi:hypothetical protein
VHAPHQFEFALSRLRDGERMPNLPPHGREESLLQQRHVSVWHALDPALLSLRVAVQDAKKALQMPQVQLGVLAARAFDRS